MVSNTTYGSVLKILAKESNTCTIISVNNRCTYSVINFRTICVHTTIVVVIITQFIKVRRHWEQQCPCPSNGV